MNQLHDASSTAIATTSGLISYPAPTPRPPTPPPAPSPPAQVLKDRLFVGNLHPTVDEYTLLQLFAKHGKVSKLDFLFHKTGPAKGKPRGYAFVEYASKEAALSALVALHDKLVRGRRLVVTYAHQAPQVDTSTSRPNRRPTTDTSRPTTLSLLKTHNRPEATKDKIAAMEAKLRQMEQKPPAAPLAVLPSSLPPKPLLSTLPSVPAGGAQRKPGAGSGSTAASTSASALHRASVPVPVPIPRSSTAGASASASASLATSTPPVRPSPTRASSSSSSAAPGKAPHAARPSSSSLKSGGGASHRRSLGIAIKR